MVALTDEGWKKSGVSLSALSREPGLPEPLKSGILPDFHIASFDFSGVPGIQGFPMDGLPTDVDIAGVLGASVVSSFRITLMANGKYAWLEPDPNIFAPKNAGETKDGVFASPNQTKQGVHRLGRGHVVGFVLAERFWAATEKA